MAFPINLSGQNGGGKECGCELPNFSGATQGGAPAGKTFGSDLPVSSIPGGGSPATTGGFSPNSANPPFPRGK